VGKLADLIDVDRKPNLQVCGVTMLLRSLAKADAADLHAALADGNVASATIARALAALGHTLRSNTIRRHRRGECGCGQAS